MITEDSDALLFGCRYVLRNIFHKSKFVEFYSSETINKDMGLTREDLIKMALFMGCDYTSGVRGIAAVNAIEVLTAFPDAAG